MSHVGISEARVQSVLEAILEKYRDWFSLRIEIPRMKLDKRNLVFLLLFAVAWDGMNSRAGLKYVAVTDHGSPVRGESLRRSHADSGAYRSRRLPIPPGFGAIIFVYFVIISEDIQVFFTFYLYVKMITLL